MNTPKSALSLASLGLLLITACTPASPSPSESAQKSALSVGTSVKSPESALLDLQRFDLQNAGLGLIQAEVEDPVYDQRKRYEGYALSQVLTLIPNQEELATDALLRLRSLDGYEVMVPVEEARSAAAVLAVRDLDAEPGELWLPLKDGSSPGPYYLVWQGTTSESTKRPWPYQVKTLELTSPLARLAATPAEDPEARLGYRIFKSHCMACHSMNLVGGKLGVELNVPRNILEYWQERDLRLYIRQPSSFRAGSKMPAFPDIDDEGLDALLSYFSHMAERKVCADAIACEELIR